MIRRTHRRRIALCAAMAGVGALGMSATANADISVNVATPGGAPVPNASVDLRAANNSRIGSSTQQNGTFTYKPSASQIAAGQFTATATASDSCRPSAERTVTSAPATVADGGQVALTLDVRHFCAPLYIPSDAPRGTAYIDPTTGSIVSAPNGLAYLRLLAPNSVTGVSVSLPDGTVLGQGTDASSLPITTPAYSGPLLAHYTTASGPPVSYTLGTLEAQPVATPKPARGKFDLAAIIDISGSMSWNDPENRRLDATHLLIELASPGDRLLGVGFDDKATTVFPRTTVVSNTTRANLRAAARKNIGNFGGTNYDIGFASAYAAMSAEPLNPAVPKAAIFLTDGANNGTYGNTHMRLAYNGTGTPWPVCVVQLGKEFNQGDTDQLKRIAAETGGRYLRAPDNAQLESLYFQCRGTSVGATTLVKRTNVFKVGQKRTYTSKVKKRQSKATFFVNWGEGKYRLALKQPGRKALYTRTTGKNVRLVKSRTFQYFQVTNPKAGKWRLQVTRLKSGAATDKASTTINVQRRR